MIPALQSAADDYVPLPRAETRRLIRAAQRGDDDAMQRLVLANIRLIIGEAGRYSGMRSAVLERDDLIDEAVIGLVRAVRKFDLGRKPPVALSTYATWWIRQSIGRLVDTRAGDLRLPAHFANAVRRVYRDGAADVGERMLARIRALPPDMLSLDAPVGEDDNRELSEIIPDPAEYDGQRVDRALLCEWLKERLDDPPLFKMFALYYGLDPQYPGGLTFEQIGLRFGLSRERIRQRVALARAQLRHPSCAAGLHRLLIGE